MMRVADRLRLIEQIGVGEIEKRRDFEAGSDGVGVFISFSLSNQVQSSGLHSFVFYNMRRHAPAIVRSGFDKTRRGTWYSGIAATHVANLSTLAQNLAVHLHFHAYYGLCDPFLAHLQTREANVDKVPYLIA